MAKMSCFSVLVGRKKKLKEVKPGVSVNYKKENGILDVKLDHPNTRSETNRLNSDNFNNIVPYEIEENLACKVKEVTHDKPVEDESEAGEEAYEGSGEDDEKPSIKRKFSDYDLQVQAQVCDREITVLPLSSQTGSSDFVGTDTNCQLETETQKNSELVLELIQSGHVSDPGIDRAEFWASPTLKRSCSTLEAGHMLRKITDQLPLKKSQSFEDLQNSTDNMTKEVLDGVHGSPLSVMTPCSADKVMLKKHSSSQVLPSRSRRLWWKLFLWSHRNTHKSRMEKPRLPSTNRTSEQRGGYCSDTLEQRRGTEPDMLESPGSFSGGSRLKDNQNWDSFHVEMSGSWPQNQWVAFSTESSFTRVNEWVNSVNDQNSHPLNDDDNGDEGIFFPASPDTKGSPARSPSRHSKRAVSEEVLHANSVIQSLNSSSTVAHISGMSLKVIPIISRFSSLRSINLSGNFIANITPGSLPKGLHALNLSRNKIATIEGLRDLTRLRVLDLSYNKISRIGQGLSTCTLIKELYLAGNKISIVEGMHRLLKLTVLDLSFNKITTGKALGQLVANYSSLLALNLLGNPVQGNVGDDQLRKVVLGLLPRLAYLNKQPIKLQRAREVGMDSVAKAALGNGGRTSRRKVQKQVGLSGSYTSHKSNLGGKKKRHLSNKSGNSSFKDRYSTVASTR